MRLVKIAMATMTAMTRAMMASVRVFMSAPFGRACRELISPQHGAPKRQCVAYVGMCMAACAA